MHSHGIHTQVQRQSKRATHGKSSEQVVDIERNQLHSDQRCSSILVPNTMTLLHNASSL